MLPKWPSKRLYAWELCVSDWGETLHQFYWPAYISYLIHEEKVVRLVTAVRNLQNLRFWNRLLTNVSWCLTIVNSSCCRDIGDDCLQSAPWDQNFWRPECLIRLSDGNKALTCAVHRHDVEPDRPESTYIAPINWDWIAFDSQHGCQGAHGVCHIFSVQSTGSHLTVTFER